MENAELKLVRFENTDILTASSSGPVIPAGALPGALYISGAGDRNPGNLQIWFDQQQYFPGESTSIQILENIHRALMANGQDLPTLEKWLYNTETNIFAIILGEIINEDNDLIEDTIGDYNGTWNWSRIGWTQLRQ